jgi:hypothetical protein
MIGVLYKFEQLNMQQVWVLQHWSGAGNGSAPDTRCTRVRDVLRKLYGYFPIFDKPWLSFCGPSTTGESLDAAFYLGNNGRPPQQPCPAVLAARKEYTPVIQVDANCEGIISPPAATVAATYTNGYQKK